MSQDDANEAAARRTRRIVSWILVAVAILELAGCLGVWLLARR
jgi:hypothetical protein